MGFDGPAGSDAMSSAAEQARWAERQAALPVRVGDTIRRRLTSRALDHHRAAGLTGGVQVFDDY